MEIRLKDSTSTKMKTKNFLDITNLIKSFPKNNFKLSPPPTILSSVYFFSLCLRKLLKSQKFLCPEEIQRIYSLNLLGRFPWGEAPAPHTNRASAHTLRSRLYYAAPIPPPLVIRGTLKDALIIVSDIPSFLPEGPCRRRWTRPAGWHRDRIPG